MTGTEHSRPNIGFIGMGHMGSHMVPRLLRAGYHLTVYDRTAERARAMGQLGAASAETPRELATRCEVIISCVTNDSALEAVMLAPDGALAGVRAESVIIDMSTVAPQTSRHLFQAARAKGVPMIDTRPIPGRMPGEIDHSPSPGAWRDNLIPIEQTETVSSQLDFVHFWEKNQA